MKKSVWAVAVLVLVAGVVATHFWLELRRERDQGSKLAARVAALEAAPPAASVLPADAPASVAGLPPAVQPPGNAAPVAAPGAAPAREAGAASNPLAAMFQNPQAREAMSQMALSAMAAMYPDVAEELGLTAEQADQLMSLVGKQQMDASMEAMSLVGGNVDAATRQEAQRKMVEQTRQLDGEITALLGSKYPQWEQYQGKATARLQVNELRSQLGGTANPLSEAQGEALLKAFTAEQVKIQREERNYMASSAAINSPNLLTESIERAAGGQRRLVDVAKPHLSAAQFDQYQRQVEQQEAMMRMVTGMLGGQKP